MEEAYHSHADFSFWRSHWHHFKKQRLGFYALLVVFLFFLMAIYAPFLSSSKPLMVAYKGSFYFPLFKYLFYPEFFTKKLDLFFNLLIFITPLMMLVLFCPCQNKSFWLALLGAFQLILFAYISYRPVDNPAGDAELNKEYQQAVLQHPLPSWPLDLKYMNDYARLNLVLEYFLQKRQHERLSSYLGNEQPESLFYVSQLRVKEKIDRLQKRVQAAQAKGSSEEMALANLSYLQERAKWLEEESHKLRFLVMPLLSQYHWEDDAGGSQKLNQKLPWWNLTRINRKDLLAALIFGTRISLVVGFLAVAIALAISIPIGALAGFYGGKTDIVVSRLLEVWEGMPTFFMLLMVVAVLQTKSIFIVIAIIGFFGWTAFSRFIRGEFYKQRHLPYIEACYSLGFSNFYIMFVHILPNAIPPVLTLLPFAIMGAISSEAGLSFLGLGEENSCSWGVLMDEGRSAFPGESQLLWPPAILLTTLLVAVALVGDALRDTFDPKMHKV